MTFTSATGRRIRTIFVLACLIGCLMPHHASAQADDQSVRGEVEQLFAAYQRKDLPAVMAKWSVKSPDLYVNRQSMQEAFSAYRTIEVKSLTFDKVTVANDQATVQVTLEANVITGTQETSTTWKASRTFQMIRENGAWRVLKYAVAEEELAAAMSATATTTEGMSLLTAKRELLTTDLVYALTRQMKELTNRNKAAQALQVSELAWNVSQQLADKTGMSVTLRLKGDIVRSQGDSKQAQDYYDRSLKLAEEVGDKAILAEVFTSLGISYALQTNLPKALEYFHRGLQIREESGDKLNMGRELSNIGNIYVSQGEYVKALESFQRSLALAIEVGNKQGSSATLNSIGTIYLSQGNYPQALEYIQQSLKIKQEIGDKPGVGRALNNIGIIYALQGQYEQALDHLQQNLKIKEELSDRPGTIEIMHNLGVFYFLKGEYAKALDYDHQVLKLAEDLGNNHLLAEIMQNMADCYLRLGQYPQAIEHADRASSLAAKTGVHEVFWIGKALAGKAHLALNQLDQARTDFLEAIATIEVLRSKVAGGEQETQLFFENKIAPYQGMIELSLAQKNPAEALSYAERAKGRTLLDVLSSGKVEYTKAFTTEELKQDRAMVAKITTLNTQLSRLKRQNNPNESQVAEITTQLEKARLEYEAFQNGLYAKHPELKVKRGQTPLLTPDEVLTLLPNRQTAILEYVVTEDRTHLFVLRKARTPVAGKTSLELTVRTIDIKNKDLSEMSEAFRESVAERNLTVKTPAGKLYDLLVKPVEEQLQGVSRLCIVPDGALWNLPFQALHNKRSYLLEEYAIYYAPSLSVLREMGRRANELSQNHQPASNGTPVMTRASANNVGALQELFALGNPTLAEETIKKARFTRRDESLSPLPDAEKEVAFLGRLYGPGRSKILIGEQAQESTVKAEAGDYNVLHFATHAVLDNRNPLYSRIVLSRTETDSKEDGLLETWEIMKLDLVAELTILSACETARGRVTAGEGVIGMSWALFVAGSPAAVVSQWKVDSTRSSELMMDFHRNLRQRSNGKPVYTRSESLRRAALKLLRGNYNHPAYWAGFILVGDDR